MFYDEARAAFLIPEPEERWVPATLELCGECRGRGIIVPAEIDQSSEDFLDLYHARRDAWTCNTCGGERVIPVFPEETP